MQSASHSSRTQSVSDIKEADDCLVFLRFFLYLTCFVYPKGPSIFYEKGEGSWLATFRNRSPERDRQADFYGIRVKVSGFFS